MRDRWHGRGRLRYAVTPRFSVSCTEAMLDACRALLDDGVMFTSHVNESPGEIAFVRELFPQARDYLDTYERAGLLGECSVLAHNVHVSDDEFDRLAASRTAVAHCPSSNAFLASGIFPMARHVEHGVRFGMGTDVGAGTGLSMLKEGLVAYHVQMVRDQGHMLGPAHLLWLATAAGARAIGLGDVCGDLRPGKAADFVLLRPGAGSTLAAVLEEAPDWNAALGAVFTLAREETVLETRVGGEVVFARESVARASAARRGRGEALGVGRSDGGETRGGRRDGGGGRRSGRGGAAARAARGGARAARAARRGGASAARRREAARRSDQDEVVPVDGLFDRAREHRSHFGGLQPHDAAELARGVVGDALADGLAVDADLDRVAGLEAAVDADDADRQQRGAAVAQRAGGAGVDGHAAQAGLA